MDTVGCDISIIFKCCQSRDISSVNNVDHSEVTKYESNVINKYGDNKQNHKSVFQVEDEKMTCCKYLILKLNNMLRVSQIIFLEF